MFFTLKRTAVSTAFLLALSISALAQGLVTQNAANFQSTDPIRGAWVVFYPTVSTFTTNGSGLVQPIATEAYDVRVKVTVGGQDFFGEMNYVDANQINVLMPYAAINSIEPYGYPTTVTIQKKVNGVWSNERSPVTYNVSGIAPQSFTTKETDGCSGGQRRTYASNGTYSCDATGTVMLNGQIWVKSGGTTVFHKNAANGTSNPRTYNSEPTYLILYATGMYSMFDANDPYAFSTTPVIKVNGTSIPSSLIVAQYRDSSPGQQQINIKVDSSYFNAGDNTIQVCYGTSCTDVVSHVVFN